jgi:hypothetical protein
MFEIFRQINRRMHIDRNDRRFIDRPMRTQGGCD